MLQLFYFLYLIVYTINFHFILCMDFYLFLHID